MSSTSEMASRAPWTQDDRRLLMEYWGELGSILLIALVMNRPEGSVQTEASRTQLPRRMEDKGKHRKKWSEQEISDLEAAVSIHTDNCGRIKIIEVANMVGRSIDAVATRLKKDYDSSEEFRDAIVIPKDLEEIKRSVSSSADILRKPAAGDTRQTAMTRTCLSCQKPFYSESAGNRICPRCKADKESAWGDHY